MLLKTYGVISGIKTRWLEKNKPHRIVIMSY